MILNPKTARPATPKPITMPPEKETANAFGRLVRAASVVRTLASVAIRIPIFPARAEKIAPTTNATTIKELVDSIKDEIMARNTPAITTKMMRTRYSADKNAKAPSLI